MEPRGGAGHVEARALHGARFRYFDFVMVAFVVVLLLSNVIGAEKRSFVDLPGIGPWPFGAGILFFPISYVIDDVLTEVYGFARARRAIWAGFAALLFMAVMEWTVVHLPVRRGWTGQPAYERVFGSGWRIILASMAAFFVGDFLNSVVLAKMKIWTKGKHLWTRTIGSTIVGEGADSLIFYPLAFYGMPDWPVAALGAVMLSQFVLKVGWEVVLTPVTYAVVGWLKRREGVDVYDVGTDFTPFTARRLNRSLAFNDGRSRATRGSRMRSFRLAIAAALLASAAAQATTVIIYRRADDPRSIYRVFDTPGPDRVLMCMAPPVDQRLHAKLHLKRARYAATVSSSPSNSRRPSVPPCAGSTTRSGCGIRPSTLPASLRIPAMSRAEPLTSSR